MAYFTNEQMRKIRDMDLLTYLQTYEPTNLVHVHGKEYCTREHDSLKISNGKWMWWSRGFGGSSALDYLIKVEGFTFLDAAKKIIGEVEAKPPIFVSNNPKESSKRLLLPDKCKIQNKVRSYLYSRGISTDIIQWCLDESLIYESLPHHSCIFVGYDDDGMARYAAFRATSEGKVMGEATGSDKRYSFRIDCPGSTLHVFEGAIDLLSFATINKHLCDDWRLDPMLSLGGVYAPKSPTTGKLPVALETYLESNPNISTVSLHLDNDYAGRSASAMLQELLKDRYEVKDAPPVFGKDMNDELLHFLGEKQKARY